MGKYNADLSAVTPFRFAAGLWVPNRIFEDYNAALYTGNKTGEDGLAWPRVTGLNHWFAYGSGAAATGFSDGYAGGNSVALTTTSTTSTVAINTNHQLGAVTLYSEMIPLSALMAQRYTKYFQVAFCANLSANATEGTHFRIALAQYSSAYAYLDYDLFDISSLTIGASGWTACTAATTGALHASTAYVQLHFGLYSAAGASTTVQLDQISLMTDPTSLVAADVYEEVTGVYIASAPQMAWAAPGVVDRMTMAGHNSRVNAHRVGPKYQFAAMWHQEDETAYNALRNAWLINTGDYDKVTMPEPMPLCCSFGMGMSPWWGYYDISGTTFDGTFTPQWTLAGQRFDVSLSFMER